MMDATCRGKAILSGQFDMSVCQAILSGKPGKRADYKIAQKLHRKQQDYWA